MGLTRTNLRRFMARADEAMADMFAATVSIGGTSYAAAGVGGSAMNTYLAGGKAEEGERIFRISKDDLGTRPTVGAELTWTDAEGPVSLFTILEVPDRPHETSWYLRCAPKQR